MFFISSNTFKIGKDKCMSTAIKRMLTPLIIVIGFAICFSTFVQAQPQRMSVENRVKILKDSLRLNDEQSEKITKILEDQRENNNGNERSPLIVIRCVPQCRD